MEARRVLRYKLEKAYIALNGLLKASLMTAQKGKIRATAMEARALSRRAMEVGPPLNIRSVEPQAYNSRSGELPCVMYLAKPRG